MGEGGAVLINNGRLKKIAESIRDWGRDCYCAPGYDNTCGKRWGWTCGQLGGELPDGYDHKYVYSHLGYNLKITDLQAACGLAQLDRLEEFIAARRANFEYLHARLSRCAKFLRLPSATLHSEPSWFGFPVTVRPESGIDRAALLAHLDHNGIATRLFFAGNVTKQPYMAGRTYRVSGTLEQTDNVMHHTFWLGVFPGVGEAQLDYVATTIERFVGVEGPRD